jgi:hypothetical protein
MEKNGQQILSAMVMAIVIASLAATPAMATDTKTKHAKKTASHSSAAAAAQATGAVPEVAQKVHVGQLDTKPGPAWRTIGGKVKDIKGNTYTVEDYEGNQVHLYVGQGTKQIRGNKKVGDTVRAEITRGGFANSVQ